MGANGHSFGRRIDAMKASPFPVEWSAEHTLTRRQRTVLIVLAALCAAAFVLDPAAAAAVVIAGFTAAFLVSTTYRIACYWKGYRRLESGHPAPAPAALPSFSVLVPLYREANVVPALLDALDALEYPRDRLEVLLLVEADDPDTEHACREGLRPGWRVIVVPHGHPRTKPRALNVALAEATGDLLTIYDAEDRPDPGQLVAAAGAFAALPETVAALQARLDYYNEGDSLLTRWFACEYATHFGLYLEGVAALGHPLPLGGTSTHFRTAAVRAVGGWDSWNVTEDCELGMRLAAHGLAVDTLDSVTAEEAVGQLRRWVRQRSRWIKGYAQTTLVLLRTPVRTARAMGPRRYAAALAGVGCVPVTLLAQPFFWLALWGYIGLRVSGADVTWIESLFPGAIHVLAFTSLLVGNFVIVLGHVAALYERGRYGLVRYALVIPLYWALASAGAWVGVIQLVRRPHFWEKTAHGQTAAAPEPSGAQP